MCVPDVSVRSGLHTQAADVIANKYSAIQTVLFLSSCVLWKFLMLLFAVDNNAYKELEEKRLREAVKDAQKIAPRAAEKHDAGGLSHLSDKAQAEKRLRGEEEDAPKIAPRVPEKDESGGITLVLLEDIELVQGQGKNYELALVTDLAAAVDADAHRFAFVGFEEGQEPRTILVHVNVRPAPASRMDRRTAMTLSHEIGKQIQHSTSKLRSSPLTRGSKLLLKQRWPLLLVWRSQDGEARVLMSC